MTRWIEHCDQLRDTHAVAIERLRAQNEKLEELLAARSMGDWAQAKKTLAKAEQIRNGHTTTSMSPYLQGLADPFTSED